MSVAVALVDPLFGAGRVLGAADPVGLVRDRIVFTNPSSRSRNKSDEDWPNSCWSNSTGSSILETTVIGVNFPFEVVVRDLSKNHPVTAPITAATR